MRSKGVGRLLVVIIEGHDLKPSNNITGKAPRLLKSTGAVYVDQDMQRGWGGGQTFHDTVVLFCLVGASLGDPMCYLFMLSSSLWKSHQFLADSSCMRLVFSPFVFFFSETFVSLFHPNCVNGICDGLILFCF